MTTYKDLKSAKYINGIVAYTEQLWDLKFKRYGGNTFTAYCPFHSDGKDSFRVYVNEKDEVRFHCFGACNTEWDIYDLIRSRKKCGFREAQSILADVLGVIDFIPYDGCSYPSEEIEDVQKPVEFLAPKEISVEVTTSLADAKGFYHRLLISNPDRFSKVLRYLHRRGLDDKTIERFRIGYAPALPDEDYNGRALINHNFDRFETDYRIFNHYVDAGLFRLLQDETTPAYGFYRKYIDYSYKDPFRCVYSDFFAGRITFSIHAVDGSICGIMGRRPDNREPRWMKQRSQETSICTKGWLYGIDKAARWIKHYKSVIIVEGIFDYFAFYRLLQDIHKPIVVSTLGTNLDEQAVALFQSLGIKNIIVAFDWDYGGRAGIKRISEKLSGQVYYLGGLMSDEDPAEKLGDVLNSISGFSMGRLTSAAKDLQRRTEKQVMVSILSRGSVPSNELIFKPDSTIDHAAMPAPTKASNAPGRYFYVRDRFLPLLTYNHSNRAVLEAKVQSLIKMMNEKPSEPPEAPYFHIYESFIKEERYDELGPALILWLRLAIEQQHRERKVKETDSTIAEWLQTSRQQISKYKTILRRLGYLNINTTTKVQKLSVQYSPK